jgi:hypothetical protein
MRVYRLSAIYSDEHSGHWQLSSIGATTCWVLADDEGKAREAVSLATIVAGENGALPAQSPWLKPHFAVCEHDESVDVPQGLLLTALGKWLSVLET